MKIRPLRDNVLIRIIEEPKEIESGIIIADTVKEFKKSIEGEVIAIGLQVDNVKVGDKIIFNTIKVNNVKIDNKEYYILKDFDILAKI